MLIELERSEMQNWLNLLNDVSHECILHVDKSGVGVSLVDGANVCIIKTKINAVSCMKFDSEVDAVYGFDLEKIHKKIKSIPNTMGNTITIEITDKFTAIRCGRYMFRTPTLDHEKIRREPRIPEIPIRNNRFTISSTNLCNALTMFGKKDYMMICDCKNVISITSFDSGDITEITFGDEVKIIESENAKALYTCEYLKPITKAMKKVTRHIDFVFGKDCPCSIFGNGNVVEFEYILAPRIESD